MSAITVRLHRIQIRILIFLIIFVIPWALSSIFSIFFFQNQKLINLIIDLNLNIFINTYIILFQALFLLLQCGYNVDEALRLEELHSSLPIFHTSQDLKYLYFFLLVYSSQSFKDVSKCHVATNNM